MLRSKQEVITKIHLIISVAVVIPVAIMYAFSPDTLFELIPKTTDEHNFYKAIMGLNLGFSVLWLMGIYNAKYLQPALLSNVIFMLGLGLGRVLSICIDGMPTYGYVYGTFAELFLGAYGLWVLKQNTIMNKA
ncbi:protein of unknown function [Formosa sp. Hel1_31_208]|uniref:DUF4345 domain-containing protein n=1 Tax=Formosa sp. Hel1_31_208 TaxID=1798225 RepID=UPI00087DDD3D|nr:DUF4345 domain-containing protein [Formosa sp. Hel1_31_208]SDR73304.1 protein of unknown function [Formosa sp. Hel1_31_208]